MNYEDIIYEFKKILENRFPGGYNYISQLAEILEVHPKTVYRKLRGETEFTLQEAVKISKALDISLEPIFNLGEKNVKHPMEIYIQDFSISKKFQEVLKVTLDAYTFASESKASTYMIATNTTPDVVYARYDWIARFCYLKWLYFNKGYQAVVPLSTVILTEEDKKVHKKYWELINNMNRSVYIFNIDMMKHITDDISFFYNLKFISTEEVQRIIDDYYLMLDELEQVCIRGFTAATGKEVDVFYSNVLLSNDITLVDSDNIKFGVIYAYFFNPIVTKSSNTFELIKKWFYSWVCSANIISLSGTKNRCEFFSKQRSDLEKLQKMICRD